MYILIITILILILYLFGSTIVKLFTSYSTHDYQKGNVWFMSLLIINISVIGFLYIYNNYISNLTGQKGNSGKPGYIGNDGVDCIVPDPKTIYYKQYVKSPSFT